MEKPSEKKKVLLVTLLTVSCAFAVYQFFELKSPVCANAQTCVPITPEVRYWWIGETFQSGGSCAVGSTVSPAFSFPVTPSNAVAAMTGWSLRNVDASDADDQWLTGSAEITSVVPSGNSLTINYRACNMDDGSGPEKDYNYQFSFMVFGWPL